MLPIIVVGVVQQYLGPEMTAVERWRARWWKRAQRAIGVYTTGYAKPKEYVCSVDVRPNDLERALWRQDFHRNIIATKKRRTLSDGEQWSESSWVYRKALWADKQLHVTLFARSDGGTDCYLHYEASNLTHPLTHWRAEGQQPGDPNGTFRTALDEANVDHFTDSGLGPE